MFGSDNFPLGPNGQFPPQRISNYGNDIAPPNRVEEIYEMSGEAKLPVTEKDFHSSINRVKAGMKNGKPNKHSNGFADIDKYRPKYAAPSSLRRYDDVLARQEIQQRGNNEWLKRRKQRFPGLEAVGPEIASDIARARARKVNPATGMSGVGFFGRNGNLGDVEQKDRQDRRQSVGYYTRRPYR